MNRVQISPRRAAILMVLAIGLLAASRAEAQIYVYEDENGVVHFSDTRHHDGFHRHEPPHFQGPTTGLGRAAPRSRGANRFDPLILRASREHRMSPGLVKAVIHVESKFDPRAISHRGARGLMQLMPATAGDLGVADPFNPWQNIDGGTRYLQQMVARFDGDLRLGLAAYHAGPARVVQYGGMPPYRATRQYVDRVLKLYRRYHADFR
jgi:soluble lytic murein transglycosylase-like protein